MKTRKFLIIPIVAASVLFLPGLAISKIYSDKPVENRTGIETFNYAPVTPAEAGFDEDLMSDSPVSNVLLKSLAPVTPAEADFTDDHDLSTGLSPETPKEAGFDENV
jgi:hypothetical protein